MSSENYEELAAETLSGDLRDVMLTHIRSMQTPWSKMSETAQSDKIFAVTNACETIVKRAVALVSSRGQDVMFCKISKFTVKGEIKAELLAASSVDNIERVAESIGQAAIMVFCSPEFYIGQKAPVSAEPDQPTLPIDGDADDKEDDKPAEKAADLQPMQTAPDETSLTPFEQGEGAAKHGLDLSHNPFDKDSDAWKAWRDGFNFAAVDTETENTDETDDQADNSGDDDDTGPDLPDADPSDAPEAA